MTLLQVSIIAGPLLAVLCGILIGITTGLAGGNGKLAVFWGVTFFTYLTIETQEDYLVGLFIVVMIFVSLAVSSYILSYFFATAGET